MDQNIAIIIPQLVAQDSTILIHKIVQYNISAIQKNLKLVEISLGIDKNSVISGKPIRLDKDGNCILLSGSDSLIYHQLFSATSFQILNPQLIWDLLTYGAYFQMPADEVPTSLQLKKEWAALGENLEKEYGIALIKEPLFTDELSDMHKYQILKLADVLKTATNAIAIDALGREMLQSIDVVRIEKSIEQLQVTLENEKEIRINVNIDKKWSSDMSQELQKQIESNF